MKYYVPVKPGLLFLLLSLALTLRSQNFNLVKDINASTDGNPYNLNTADDKPAFAVLNGVAYFSAYISSKAGYGLWRSDTAAASVSLVRSFPNTVSSIAAAGGKIYFYTYNSYTYSFDVYVSNGTAAGTLAIATGLKDINEASFTAAGNYVYFEALGRQLWKTDGTAASTKLVADFGTQRFRFSGGLLQLTAVGNTLYFTLGSDEKFGPELWKSDGSLAGTKLVKDINPGFRGSMPGNLTPAGDKLYFTANDGNITSLWMTDGTTTAAVTNNNNIVVKTGFYFSYQEDDSTYYTYYSDEEPFAVADSTIYFQATQDAYGTELGSYKINDTINGIKIVADINPGGEGSFPENITLVGNKIFFSCTNFTGDNFLYKTGTTAAGVVLVKDIDPGVKTYFSNFVNVRGNLFFSYYNEKYGYEIWRSDGTAEGTSIIKDIFAGIYSSYADELTYVKSGVVLFAANNGINGTELWKTDGTETGTIMMKDINTSTTSSSNPLTESNSAVLGDQMYFTAYTPKYGNEPYVTNGTPGGTKLLFDVVPGSNSGKSDFFTACNHKMYFVENESADGHSVIYKVDSATNKTSVVTILSGTKGYVSKLIATDNLLYFFYYDYDLSRNIDLQLWRTDGTPAGTYEIKNLSSFYSPEPVAVGNTLFFNGFDDIYGIELWKTNGTPQSTQLVKDINPGIDDSEPFYGIAFNGKLYFAAQTAQGKRRLYVSDGTTAGTKQVSGAVEVYSDMVEADGKVFFPGYTRKEGVELWASDGTTTTMVKDILEGKPGSGASDLFAVGSTVYFLADDQLHGGELWTSDGTTNGTHLVKDITPGTVNGLPADTYFFDFASAGGKLYFMAETIDSLEDYNDSLFVSDGTEAGTHTIQDNGLLNVTEISTDYAFASFKGKVYFSAFTAGKGWELYAGSMPDGLLLQANEFAVKKEAPLFSALVYPNPVSAKTTIHITGNNRPASLIITDVNGRILQVRNNLPAGTYSLSLGGLSAGVYFAHVSDGTNSRLIKLLKP